MTAEVPYLPDGCRVMNPVPIRLPFDIEVCGLEKIVAEPQKEPLNYNLTAGVHPDIKWTNKELIEMFKITKSI